MKAIIYCRKSTDRGDRQQLSIESQMEEANKIVKREWLEVIKIFKETQTAKQPWRPQFNEMMKLLNKWKVDCIVTWKLNRLARNPIDEWTIKWVIQSGVIKTIFTEWEVFNTGDNVLIMWMHFWMSTQYILDLQKDIKRWIKSKISNWWVCQKAPLWFINNRLEKTIEIDSVKSKWVKEIFKLRSENMSYKLIAQTLFNKWIKGKNWKSIPDSTIDRLIKNKFYIWLVKHNWEYYKWKYKTFISKNLFERAQNVGQWISYRANSPQICYLKWFLRDEKNNLLSWYVKKGHTYYRGSTVWIKSLNISQRIILEHFEKELEGIKADEYFKELNKEIILKIFEANRPEEFETIKEIDFKIRKLTAKKEDLLDLRLEWEIGKNIFIDKSNNIVLNIEELENDKKELKNNNIEKKIKLFLELNEKLYSTYRTADNENKSLIIKSLFLELFINSKKELSYAENSLFNSFKLLHFYTKNEMEVPSGLEPE